MFPLKVIVSRSTDITSPSPAKPMTFPSMVIVLSIVNAEPSAGTISIPPTEVMILIEPSPIIILSAAIAVGIPHIPDPSPSDIQD